MNWEGIDYEFHLNVNCTTDDVGDAFFRKTVDQFGEKEAQEVSVGPFIATDEFIAEAEARHESALLKPEYGAERAQEGNASTSANAIIHLANWHWWDSPFESQIGFTLNTW